MTDTTAATEGPQWTATARIWIQHWARLSDPARELIADRTGIRPGTSVLDMGCGSGEFLALAASRGATVSGIDAADGMLELARERLERADLRRGPIERLPWPDDAFDGVTGFKSFQFAAERLAPFREAVRVARPRGSVAVWCGGPVSAMRCHRCSTRCASSRTWTRMRAMGRGWATRACWKRAPRTLASPSGRRAMSPSRTRRPMPKR